MTYAAILTGFGIALFICGLLLVILSSIEIKRINAYFTNRITLEDPLPLPSAKLGDPRDCKPVNKRFLLTDVESCTRIATYPPVGQEGEQETEVSVPALRFRNPKENHEPEQILFMDGKNPARFAIRGPVPADFTTEELRLNAAKRGDGVRIALGSLMLLLSFVCFYGVYKEMK